MTTATITDTVLREILEAFVESKKLPSPDAVGQLATAAGLSVQQLRDEFTEVYQDTDLSDADPWSGKAG